MRSLLINLILCTFLFGCASSNSYKKKYKDYSCDQIEKEGDKILSELGQNKSHFGDKILEGVVITWDILTIVGGHPMIDTQKSSACKGVHRMNLQNAYKALEDLAIEKGCPSKDLILKRRQMIERSLNADGRIDSRYRRKPGNLKVLYYYQCFFYLLLAAHFFAKQISCAHNGKSVGSKPIHILSYRHI
jgi:hypothetical protein